MTRAANLAKLITDANLEGTLDVTGIGTFTDDIIIGDGKTIGSASDVDAITIASNGQLTLTQTLIGTSLDISGDIDVDGTANLDVVDIDGAVDMASTLQVDGAITSSASMTITTTSTNPILHLKSTTNAQPNLKIETENAGANGGRLDFLHKSSSPADGDLLGDITFGGYSDDGTPPSDFARYVMMKAFASDVSNNAEKGRLTFSLHNGASNENNVDVLTLNGDKVGIGLNSPSTSLHIRSSVASNIAGYRDGTTGLIVEGDAASYIQLVASKRWTINETGNLLPSATSLGVYLGVTSATASNLLDDYEEGSFTATFSASGATIGQSVSKGTYTKIGNQVNINIYVQCDGTVSLNSNALSITGLPFTAANTSQVIYYGPPAGMRFISMSSNYYNLMPYINSGDNTVQMYQHGKGQAPIALPSSGLSNSSGQIFIQMFYYV
jgi:hypothetical protein